MNATMRVAAAAAFSVGCGITTQETAAQGVGPFVVGTGENASVEYATPSLNIVGGALSRTTGSGESASTEILSAPVTQPGRLSRVTGSGESQDIIYLDAAPGARPPRGVERR